MTSHVFTIPTHVAFGDALAAGLLAERGDDPLALARTTIVLPNRRAVRALTDAFVRASGSGLLLPRMTPVGDVDAATADLGALDVLGTAPPPVDPTKRRLLLAQLIRHRHRAERPAEPDLAAIAALRLADQLAAALDAMQIEEVAPSALKAFDAAELAHHWEATLRFLSVVTDHWPPILAAHGDAEAAADTARRLDALAARWRAVPPGPVVAAGFESATPAVARLLRTIARLPNGRVVLPGLDTAMPEPVWAAIRCRATDPDAVESETHPQFTLKCLLDALGVARGEVAVWPATGDRDGPPERARVVAEAMAPAAFTGDWQAFDPAALAGVRQVEAANPAEEAQVVALALRRALDTPGKTAALVTPDRALARRVAAHCRRWGIVIDDTAGTPLKLTPPGTLFLELVEAAARGFGVVPLLALLKHPLVRTGAARTDWLAEVRRLDIGLRGVRPAPGLDGIAARLDEDSRHLLPWWGGVAALLDPLERLFARPLVAFAELVAALKAVAGALCGEALWQGPAGRALGEVVGSLEAHGHHLDPFAPLDAPALVAAFLGEAPVRRAFGTHPRLAIYGTLEARLQRTDLTIVGGLNEGVWPGRPTPDPWLAPRLRRHLALPSLERRIGLAGHDFAAALGGPEVLLTRAIRDDSAPAVASRFWLRLQAQTGGIVADDDLLRVARALDASAAMTPYSRPSPAPPAAERPRRLSITAVDRLKADPFSYYAAAMLRLDPLDPLDADATSRDRGVAVHDVLERWLKSGDADADALRALTEQELLRWNGYPLLRALWFPRVRRAMEWAAEALDEARDKGWTPVAAEAQGGIDVGGVLLRGKADRVDRAADGSLAIIDYKTGEPPTSATVADGFALQLGLLAWLAEAGALTGVGPAAVSTLTYWKLGGGKDPGKVVNPLGKAPAADHVAFARAEVEALCAGLLLGDAPFVALKHPDRARGGTYDQLMRRGEWLGRA